LPKLGHIRSISCSRWRTCPGAKASSFTRLLVFLRCHFPSATAREPTQTLKPPKRRTRTGKGPSEERCLRVGSLAASACISLPVQRPGCLPSSGDPSFSNSHSIRSEGEPSNHSNAVFLQFSGEALRTRSRRNSSQKAPSTNFGDVGASCTLLGAERGTLGSSSPPERSTHP
jgi:hypothetical protein